MASDRDEWHLEGQGPDASQHDEAAARAEDLIRAGDRRTADSCLRCGTPLQPLGEVDIRVGGTTGKWKLLFGELAELGEGFLNLEVCGCPQCRTLEFRMP
jgi:hypothetical protein